MTLGPTEIGLIAAAAYAIGSEIVGMNPKWKSNSLVQLAGVGLKKIAKLSGGK